VHVLRIGGFQKVSLMDYPGRVSSIVFTMGCNFRCPFCYVPNLVLPERFRGAEGIPPSAVFSYLDSHKGLIDAVVVTGGEPTMQADLPDFLRKVKERGLLAGIETQGSNTLMLESLLSAGLVDYIGMDIKNALEFDDYNLATGGMLSKQLFDNVKKSIALVRESGIEHEFRTTVAKGIHTPESIGRLCRYIRGEERYFLQNFRTGVETIGNGNASLSPFSQGELDAILSEARKYVNAALR
jgi:pyruvate formate lyase activating enzyme